MESNFYCARKNVTASKSIYFYFVCSTPPTPLHALRSHHSMIFISPAFSVFYVIFLSVVFFCPGHLEMAKFGCCSLSCLLYFFRLLLRATQIGFEDDATELSCDDEAARGGGGLESNEITFQLLTCHSPRKSFVGREFIFGRVKSLRGGEFPRRSRNPFRDK